MLNMNEMNDDGSEKRGSTGNMCSVFSKKNDEFMCRSLRKKLGGKLAKSRPERESMYVSVAICFFAFSTQENLIFCK